MDRPSPEEWGVFVEWAKWAVDPARTQGHDTTGDWMAPAWRAEHGGDPIAMEVLMQAVDARSENGSPIHRSAKPIALAMGETVVRTRGGNRPELGARDARIVTAVRFLERVAGLPATRSPATRSGTKGPTFGRRGGSALDCVGEAMHGKKHAGFESMRTVWKAAWAADAKCTEHGHAALNDRERILLTALIFGDVMALAFREFQFHHDTSGPSPHGRDTHR